MATGLDHAAGIADSRAFETLASGAQFRDRIAIRASASPEAIFRAVRDVTLGDMPLARTVGEIRYLPSRLFGRHRAADIHTPFFTTLIQDGTLLLTNDAPKEIITGSAGRLHQVVDQAPVHFPSRAAFHAFDDPGCEKLFMSLRVEPTGTPGQQWLVLDHATQALSEEAERKFRRYWLFIKPGGAFVTRQLLKAIRRLAEGPPDEVLLRTALPRHPRSVRATRHEQMQPLPGDRFIAAPKAEMTHAVVIRRPPREVWPWLAQMGAGSRAGWYSYDLLDNGRRRSAVQVIPELQQLSTGMVFPALPGEAAGFTLLAFQSEHFLVLGWPSPDGGAPLVTWAFVLRPADVGGTRLVVRVRAGDVYDFHGIPWPVGKHVAAAVHFVMQRKQLLGIARRAEQEAA